MSVALCARAAETAWTGAAGNYLWGDPANWSNGVPDASTDDTILETSKDLKTIELGGVTRPAA